MSEATKRFGERLTMARMLTLRLSQAALAQRLGIDLSLLQRAERGDLDTVPESLANALEAIERRDAGDHFTTNGAKAHGGTDQFPEGVGACAPISSAANGPSGRIAPARARSLEVQEPSATDLGIAAGIAVPRSGEGGDPDAGRRAQWRRFMIESQRISAENERRRRLPPSSCDISGRPVWLADLRHSPFPEELRGLTCGARNRSGGRCKRIDLGISGRCKFHGGASTGPRTDQGRENAAANLKLRWMTKENSGG